MTRQLTYSAVTPVRNEAANLERLADSMASQSLQPRQWLIVDNGSDDESPAVIARDRRATVVRVDDHRAERRIRPACAAVRSSRRSRREPQRSTLRCDVVVKLDADVSFEDDYFERLLRAFASNDRLGIASGTCYEQDGKGEWRPTFTTRDHVRGATRAYRTECFRLVTPLEERMGWDGIDELKAQVAGWQTASLPDVRFYHHRAARRPRARVVEVGRPG